MDFVTKTTLRSAIALAAFAHNKIVIHARAIAETATKADVIRVHAMEEAVIKMVVKYALVTEEIVIKLHAMKEPVLAAIAQEAVMLWIVAVTFASTATALTTQSQTKHAAAVAFASTDNAFLSRSVLLLPTSVPHAKTAELAKSSLARPSVFALLATLDQLAKRLFAAMTFAETVSNAWTKFVSQIQRQPVILVCFVSMNTARAECASELVSVRTGFKTARLVTTTIHHQTAGIVVKRVIPYQTLPKLVMTVTTETRRLTSICAKWMEHVKESLLHVLLPDVAHAKAVFTKLEHASTTVTSVVVTNAICATQLQTVVS